MDLAATTFLPNRATIEESELGEHPRGLPPGPTNQTSAQRHENLRDTTSAARAANTCLTPHER